MSDRRRFLIGQEDSGVTYSVTMNSNKYAAYSGARSKVVDGYKGNEESIVRIQFNYSVIGLVPINYEFVEGKQYKIKLNHIDYYSKTNPKTNHVTNTELRWYQVPNELDTPFNGSSAFVNKITILENTDEVEADFTFGKGMKYVYVGLYVAGSQVGTYEFGGFTITEL